MLALAVIAALALANSPLRDEYNRFFDYHFGFMFNGKPFLNFSVAHWINDGFMSMFFFVVGLELKSEFIGGELRDIRKVTLPVAAALLGMVVPAVLYLLLNGSAPVANGWGIPMATDIAFALAVVYMLGDRVPISAKVFLTTLAIVDDIGAVLVIALFYTSEISFATLAVGFAVLGVMFLANRLGVKNVVFYGLLGIGGVWLAFLMSGIHATIAAVLAAMVIPADSRIPETAFIARIKRHVRLFENMEGNDVRTLEPGQVDILSKVSADTIHAVPPLQRLEHGLHPWVSFVVMPMFALANAGVSFVDMDMSAITGSHVADHHRYQQRIYAARSLFQELTVFPLHSLKASDSGSQTYAYTVRVLLFHINAGILQCFLRSGYGELGETLHTLSSLRIHIILRIKILYLGRKLCLIFGCIKLGNRSDSHLFLFQSVPETLYVISDRCNCSHTCYYNSCLHVALSLLHYNSCPTVHLLNSYVTSPFRRPR